MTINEKDQRKKLKSRDLESVQDDNPVDHQNQKPVGYKCSTCNKCFPNHQALCGHRSSHNKVSNFHNTIDESSSTAAGDGHHAYPITQGLGIEYSWDEDKEEVIVFLTASMYEIGTPHRRSATQGSLRDALDQPIAQDRLL
ncbi:hypothetical protein F0562_005858 [Nyssa sinensis]|uniref:C2H2-type domain-containing protein n=1 Tax=Nyssa sinensis TaxID=561372 RepID=A0A5J5ALV1_9ASTE|nr:hypothetical protein F0562_005858 [Nyssa sinensis]